ncbi:MAG: SMC-Scp complex subunit ScpB [Pseudomonadota bacterium]
MKVKAIVEAVIMTSSKPISSKQILAVFDDAERPAQEELLSVIQDLQEEADNRGVELVEVSSGFRYQAKAELAPWLSKLWEEKPARYSRALLETLALIAYRQPITRADIENIRGVSVSTSIIKTLLEREWVRVVGHKDVPGRPALYATTKTFLDYFNLKSLEALPSLVELSDLDVTGEKAEEVLESEEKVVQAQQLKQASARLMQSIKEVLFPPPAVKLAVSKDETFSEATESASDLDTHPTP